MPLARPERFRVVLRDEVSGSTPLDLPARKRALGAGLFLAACFAIFAGVMLFPVAGMRGHAMRDVFDLSFLLFEGFWVLGWSVGVFILGALTVIVLFYRDSARLQGSKLVYVPRLGPLKIIVEYDLARIRDLRTDPAAGSDEVRIRFAYRDGDSGLGDRMPRRDAERIIEAIRNAAAAAGGPAGVAAASQAPAAGATAPVGPVASPVSASPLPLASASSLALIAANLLPLAGVLLLGWDIAQVVVLYWAESAVIGFYTALKIVMAGRLFALLAVPFFVGHYGAFMAVHLLLVYGLFVRGLDTSGPAPPVREALLGIFAPLWLALAALFVSHGVSFAVNFLGRREYVEAEVAQLMAAPYQRIFVMQLTLILGGWIVMFLKSPVPALALLIVLKIAADVSAHRREHGVRNLLKDDG